MSSLNVASMKTFGKKLSTFIGLGLTGLIIYYGIAKIDEANTNSEFEERVKYAQELAKEHKFDLAEKVFAEYKEQKLLRPEDKIRIDAEIKKERLDAEKQTEISEVENLISKSIPDARAKLEDMKTKRIFTKNEISELESKIYKKSEEGLREAMLRPGGGPIKKSICEEYLSKYSQGEYRQEAIRQLFIVQLGELKSQLKDFTEFKTVYSNVTKLNNDLAKYKDEGISLAWIIDFKSIEKDAKTYADSLDHVSDESFFTNQRVRFTKTRYELPEDYINERDKLIPKGATGKIIDIKKPFSGSYTYIVRIDEADDFPWTQGWDVSDYWIEGKRNVAAFKYEELTLNPEINEIEKNEFMHQLKVLEQTLQVYTSR